ncbi:hypothetical protein [Parachitinimonas caeni]|uniref:Uncharacterized protein n=1 Tax=Parachitinimonas caeni TaxID=3031301 RepID=A0ABT7E232_9NEIS|nr:hypothetical protein [Parachitinimonas caeni]MDK2125470.1 hypothetical protein [Parachitinimonas caeni]
MSGAFKVHRNGQLQEASSLLVRTDADGSPKLLPVQTVYTRPANAVALQRIRSWLQPAAGAATLLHDGSTLLFGQAGTYSLLVPHGVSQLAVLLVGAGASFHSGAGAKGGGGRVLAGNALAVTAGETLSIVVGKGGRTGSGGAYVKAGNSSLTRGASGAALTYLAASADNQDGSPLPPGGVQLPGKDEKSGLIGFKACPWSDGGADWRKSGNGSGVLASPGLDGLAVVSLLPFQLATLP